MNKNRDESKSVEKINKYRVMFKNILKFLVLDYRDASFCTLHSGHSSNDNRVAKLFKSYLTTTDVSMQSR